MPWQVPFPSRPEGLIRRLVDGAFEITVSAAIGAGLARLERALTALKGK